MAIDQFDYSAGALPSPWGSIGAYSVAEANGAGQAINQTEYATQGGRRTDWTADSARLRLSAGHNLRTNLCLRSSASSVGYRADAVLTAGAVTRLYIYKESGWLNASATFSEDISAKEVDLYFTLNSSTGLLTFQLLETNGTVIQQVTVTDGGTLLDAGNVGFYCTQSTPVVTASFEAISDGEAIVGDTTAPVLSAPTASATGDTTATGQVTTDEANGTLFVWETANATEASGDIITNGVSQSVTAAGAQTVNTTGLTAATAYYRHYVHRDLAGNISNVVTSAQFTTNSPEMSIVGISNANPQPGDTVTITLANASASGKTLACSAGAITPTAQDATSIAFVCPHPVTFGDTTLPFEEAINISVTDGAVTRVIPITIAVEIGYYYGQIASLDGNGEFLGTAGVAVGDWIYGHYTSGTGNVQIAISSVQMDAGSSFEWWGRDASDNNLWSATSGTYSHSGIGLTIPAKTGVEPGGLEESAAFTPTGYNLDEAQSASVGVGGEWAVSLDGGASFSAFQSTAGTVTHVTGQPAPQIKLRRQAPVSYGDTVSTTFTFGGVAATWPLSTRAAVAPTITAQPTAQLVQAAAQFTFSVTATGPATLTYQWLRNGVAISGATSASYTGTAGVNGDSGDSFQVRVTSGEGGVTTSNLAALSIAAAGATISVGAIRNVETKALQLSATFDVVVRDPATLAALLSTTVTTDAAGSAPAIASDVDTVGANGSAVLLDFYDSSSGQRHMYPATVAA